MIDTFQNWMNFKYYSTYAFTNTSLSLGIMDCFAKGGGIK